MEIEQVKRQTFYVDKNCDSHVCNICGKSGALILCKTCDIHYHKDCYI